MPRLLHFPLLLLALTATVHSSPTQQNRATNGKQLLYILLDGFRYDYVDLQTADTLPGFTRFLSNGVRAEWVDPLYPTLSYPSWTALSTGLYAESHNIIGNYFYDPVDRTNFSLFDDDATGLEKWWTSEPIWTTATKAGLRAALILWSRCDVPVDGVLPEYCEKFVKITGKQIFEDNINKALDKLGEGYDLVQIYNEHTDNIGHDHGPEGSEILQAVRDYDGILMDMQDRLVEMGLEDSVNIVIVSDHGMTLTRPGHVTRIEIDDYLMELPADAVENMADKGAYGIVKVKEGYVDMVYEALVAMPGVDVYRKEDIPEEFHVKDALYMHEILVWAQMGYFVMSSSTGIALPQRDTYVYIGAHGYDARNMDMKSIFFAKGPDFKTGEMIDPINIVDIYQVLAHVMDIDPMPHNGTWDSVKGAFSHSPKGSFASLPFTLVAIIFVFLKNLAM